MIDLTKRWQVIEGDCLEVLRELPDGCVDAVVTDPPYGVGFKYASYDDDPDKYEGWCRQWFPELRRVSPAILMSSGTNNVAMWGRIDPPDWIVAWLKPAAMGRCPLGFCNWEPMPLWGKPRRDTVDVFTAPIIPDDALDGHPCPKPLRWGTESLRRVSDEGGFILDPFCGSGTTGVACMQTGRRFIGIEIDPGYCAIARRRIAEAAATLWTPPEPPPVTPELFTDLRSIAAETQP